MNVVYAHQWINTVFPSVFLAGPTPRDAGVESWRPAVIEEFKNQNWNGYLYSPEASDGVWKNDYIGQVEWEQDYLEKANIILFWVPRELDTMPAFTTNVEFGIFLKSGKIVYGRPDDAPKNSYLDYCYRKFVGREPINNIKDTVREAINQLSNRLIFCTNPKQAVLNFFLRENDNFAIFAKHAADLIAKESQIDRVIIIDTITDLLSSKEILLSDDKKLRLNKYGIIKDIIL